VGERPPIVLASASPRRRELLSAALAPIGVVPQVRPVEIDETPRVGETPDGLARRLAAAKARGEGVSADGWIVAADTVVDLGGAIVGTPDTRKDATQMLTRLLGRTHRVVTGVAVARGSSVAVATASARVRLAALDRARLREYLASDAWRGKAGGYGVQDPGWGLVVAVTGDLSTVIGLPLRTLAGLLAASGWNPTG